MHLINKVYTEIIFIAFKYKNENTTLVVSILWYSQVLVSEEKISNAMLLYPK